MLLMLLSLVTTACGQAKQSDNQTSNSNMEKKILTVFFSMKGETYMAGGRIENLEKGNTNVCAEYIQKAVGGTLFEIETTKVYSKDHFKMIEEAKEEMQSGEKAQPKHWLSNLEDYDVIFVGYPSGGAPILPSSTPSLSTTTCRARRLSRSRRARAAGC